MVRGDGRNEEEGEGVRGGERMLEAGFWGGLWRSTFLVRQGLMVGYVSYA